MRARERKRVQKKCSEDILENDADNKANCEDENDDEHGEGAAGDVEESEELKPSGEEMKGNSAKS